MVPVNRRFEHELATPYPPMQRRRYRLDDTTKMSLDSLRALCRDQPLTTQNRLAHAQVIALSVAASSTIEGEGLPNDLIKGIINADPDESDRDQLQRLWAMTEAGEHVNEDLRNRIESYQDIRGEYEKLLRISSFVAISPELICKTHRGMFNRAKPHIAGSLKTKEVQIVWHKPNGQVERVPTVPAEQVSEHVTALCQLVNLRLSDEPIGNILLVAEFCCDFLAVHPFPDGNGRLARMLCGYLLKRTGYHLIEAYPLEQVILETRARYYTSLNESQFYWRREGEDLSPWIHYFIDCLTEHSRRALRAEALSNA